VYIHRTSFCRTALAVLLLSSPLAASLATAQDPNPVRVALMESMYRGLNEKSREGMTRHMGEMVREQSGLAVDFKALNDPVELARQLQNNTIQMGVLHGVEFAWVMKQYPDLKPLVLACNDSIKLKGYLLVRDDSPYKSVADLKGKTLAMSERTLNHCYLFVHKNIVEAGHDPEGFFAATPPAEGIHASLDTLLDGKVDAVLADGFALETYREQKPGRARKLRVLSESSVFPAAVFVHKPGSLKEETIQRFVKSMTTSHEKPKGQVVLTYWRISQFMNVPAEYYPLLNSVLEEYPKPLQPATFVANPGPAK
jgi:phosphonate transport system substrate-binding protein